MNDLLYLDGSQQGIRRHLSREVINFTTTEKITLQAAFPPNSQPTPTIIHNMITGAMAIFTPNSVAVKVYIIRKLSQ